MRANLLMQSAPPAVAPSQPVPSAPVAPVAPAVLSMQTTSQHIPNVTAAPPDELDGFSFGTPLAVPAKKKGTNYPVVPDSDGAIAAIAAQYRLDKEQFDALEGSIDRMRRQIVEMVTPEYFRLNRGIAQAESSVKVSTGNGGLLVTFPDKWSLPQSAAAVKEAIGSDLAKQLFRPAFEMKVKSESLPEGPQTQMLLNEVFAVFAKYGATAAVEFKKSVKPRKGFNAIRHARLTPEQNAAIQAVCPIQVMVKTKED